MLDQLSHPGAPETNHFNNIHNHLHTPHTHIHVCIHVCTQMHIHWGIDVNIYIHTYAHICEYIFIHIYFPSVCLLLFMSFCFILTIPKFFLQSSFSIILFLLNFSVMNIKILFSQVIKKFTYIFPSNRNL